MKNKKSDISNLIPGKLYVYPELWDYLHGKQMAELLGYNKKCPMVFLKYVVYKFMDDRTECQDNVSELSADVREVIYKYDSHSSDSPFHTAACFVFYDFYEQRQRNLNLRIGKEIVFHNF